ncbi:MAG: hypothetical protein KGH49_00495 [Candidatus Micrarchaeota archaeon]|nr:hypothetical protein [Candidatus Micrarchaeota archaeon]
MKVKESTVGIGAAFKESVRPAERIENIPTAKLIEMGCMYYPIHVKDLLLITPEILKNNVEAGTKLISVGGRAVTVGKDIIDPETRGEVLGYGVVRPQE